MPAQDMVVDSKDMEFRYDSAFKNQAIPEAYEPLLQDCLDGDASLVMRSGHIEEAWGIVDPLLNGQGLGPVHAYEPGSWGLATAAGLFARNGHLWNSVCAPQGEDHA